MGSYGKGTSPGGMSPCGEIKERSTRGSVSNENNILLDPDVLTDYPTQALLLTVLVSVTSRQLPINLMLPCKDHSLPADHEYSRFNQFY